MSKETSIKEPDKKIKVIYMEKGKTEKTDYQNQKPGVQGQASSCRGSCLIREAFLLAAPMVPAQMFTPAFQR